MVCSAPRGMKRGMWLVLLFTLGFSCSKSNDVDVNNGSLATGSPCEAGQDDPCAGSCIAGVCRAACGTNRECPVDQVCVGDGERTGCVSTSFGSLDLLQDCAAGCSVELPDFGREGTFYECDLQGLEPLPRTTDELLALGRPDIDPSVECQGLAYPVLSVKGGFIWRSYDCARFGAAGDKRVMHSLTCPPARQFSATVQVGWGYESGGDSYWLTGLYGGGVHLLKFQPEAAGNVPESCTQPESCQQPSYPAIGGVPDGLDGFWARCPSTPGAENMADVFDAEACSQLSWGDDGFRWETGGTRALYVRSDGYGIGADWPGYLSQGECTSAFRKGEAPNAVVNMTYVAAGELLTRVQFWDRFELNGESLLEVRDQENSNVMTLFRKVATPPEFTDPCEGVPPEFGY